ncbi:hypothetical protein NOM01_04380 [Sporolactobacillus sp. STSJ-5]|uniref:hypothetical protein n=1 Tax=Sporolactobacillus sp. STSJ-5 TaxID=2965076 RepID=UPI0021075ED3|nr:hypothetical protein [Sporolactobacillus sp. STSJ-5]MCQ2009230.1 hypothetical protein [Sporolactobacillus sp. STSJ-5]
MKAIYNLVREELPEASDADCRRILQQTNYPFCSLERLEYQIRHEALMYRRKKAKRNG